MSQSNFAISLQPSTPVVSAQPLNDIKLGNGDPPDDNVLWRCRDGSKFDSRTTIDLDWYEIISKTKHGAWIIDDDQRRRFVNLSAAKKWATVTPREAVMQLLSRRNRQISIISAQLEQAKAIKSLCDTVIPLMHTGKRI